MDDADNPKPEDTFKILVATDCHLGYAEKDPERGADSFIAFEEILRMGKEHNVDFVLLGGDLFHDNKPSRYTMHECIRLLRKYSLGDKPIEFDVSTELLDEEAATVVVNAEEVENGTDCPRAGIINYKDPNLNVSYPVFSIHGNHDDPAGRDQLCSLDLLSTMGLVNHFGKSLSMNNICVRPLLLQKGATKLALYGLGSVRDERLHRIFREGNVSMVRPKQDMEEWFNLLVLHQNRYKHSETSYIPESFLDDFLDLVIWGHEHECLITPQRSEKNFFVSQPGSSVATSLSAGEAVKKHVGLLQINKNNFKMEELALRTVRPFIFHEMSLQNTSLDLTQNSQDKIMTYFETLVESLIEKSREQLSGAKEQPTIPLIRIRVEIQDDDHEVSRPRFAAKFVGKVANSKDLPILHFLKKRQKIKREDGIEEMDIKVETFDIDKFSAVDFVHNYFEGAEEKNRLQLLTVTGLGKATKEFVDKAEVEAIQELIRHQMDKTQKYLIAQQVTKENLRDELIKYHEERRLKATEEEADVNEALAEAKKKRIEAGTGFSDSEVSNIEEENDNDSLSGTSTKPKRGAARGRARGRGRGQTATRSPKAASTSRGRGARGGKGKDTTPVFSVFEKSRTSGRTTRATPTYTIDDSDSDGDAYENNRSKRKRSAATPTSNKKARAIEFDDSEDDY